MTGIELQYEVSIGRNFVIDHHGGIDIGIGAKLLGPITIGDNVLIGANAAVLCDVPCDSIAVGVPARV